MKIRTVLLAVALMALSLRAYALGTGFSYQGVLSTPTGPANGLYDLSFSLYAGSSGGSALYGPVTNLAVNIANGQFTTSVDFGPGAFNGTTYWLQIGASTNGGGGFGVIAQREQILPTPYAIFAPTAGSAGSLSGVLSSVNLAGTYGNAVTLNNSGNVFAGNGSGLLNVTAQTLGGLAPAAFWQINGNVGTTAGANFLGTTDNQPLELRVNGVRGLRIEPNGGGTPNIIGGSSANAVAAGINGATIAGGGTLTGSNYVSAGGGTIGGGTHNTASSFNAVVSGGANNIASGNASSVAGGSENSANSDHGAIGGGQGNSINASAEHATILGGLNNLIGNNAIYSTIGGGQNNQASGQIATVPGGNGNSASGTYSFAAGNLANAAHAGAFVWADSQNGVFSSTAINEFNIRAQNGVRIQANKGIHLTAADSPLIVRDWDVFGASAPASKVGIGRWGLFMEPSVLTVGIPSDDVPGRSFQVAKYATDGTTTPLMTVDQAGTTTATSFVGNGSVPWQAVTGTLLAQPNSGYLATGASLVTITLPTGPNLGDIVRVSGGGTGGWRISQNAGQSITGSFSNGSTTTAGTGGFLTGSQLAVVELQYIGNSQFTPLSQEGTMQVH